MKWEGGGGSLLVWFEPLQKQVVLILVCCHILSSGDNFETANTF